MQGSGRFDPLLAGLLIALCVFMLGMFATNAEFRFALMHPLSG
jgi:hypothetical protein